MLSQLHYGPLQTNKDRMLYMDIKTQNNLPLSNCKSAEACGIAPPSLIRSSTTCMRGSANFHNYSYYFVGSDVIYARIDLCFLLTWYSTRTSSPHVVQEVVVGKSSWGEGEADMRMSSVDENNGHQQRGNHRGLHFHVLWRSGAIAFEAGLQIDQWFCA